MVGSYGGDLYVDSLTTPVEASSAHVISRSLMRPRRLLLAADGAAACLAFVAGVLILHYRGLLQHRTATAPLLMAMLIVLAAVALMMRAGQYTNRRRMSRLADLVQLIRSLFIGAAIIALLAYLTRGLFSEVNASRLVVGGMVIVFATCALGARLLLSSYQRRQFAQGHALRRILLLGGGVAAREFSEFLDRRPWLGISRQGRITFDGESEARNLCNPGLQTVAHLTSDLEGLRELQRAMRVSGATEVVVALDPEDQAIAHQVTELLSIANVPFMIVPTLFESCYQATNILGFEELPVINVEVDPLDRVARLFKRIFDLVIVAVCAIIGLVPIALIVIAILLDDGLPVIYKQERVGKNGRRFWLYKFRTMVKNADRLLDDLKDQNEAGSEQLFKMRNDPRITRVGKVLRKLSLDELPQMLNVLKGEMSVVGPRPPLPAEVQTYEQQHYCRLRGLPGITGLWQVSGRSDLSFDDMVKLDRYYLENWSLKLDLRILLKTFFVVLGRKGAY